jgi:4-hydroxybenzoate polyprenyltransferase
MSHIIAFLRLIRSLNLLFIIFTQWLFQYALVKPILHQAGLEPLLNDRLFWLLVLASVCIAAAGYIINDYFDINIDLINKPDRLIVEKVIRRRSAILWHWALSATGVVLSTYIGLQINNSLYLGIANLLCVVLLWVYSTMLKKRLLIGNVVIAILTAWVVMILYFIEAGRHLFLYDDSAQLSTFSRVFKFSVLYGGFAFIITLIREVVKDMEDIKGDSQFGCVTLPILYGIRTAKIFVLTWLVVMIGGIVVLQVYLIPFRWWIAIAYNFVFVLIPLSVIFLRSFKAHTQPEFRNLSHWIKFVMFTGILSIVFLSVYG